MSIRILLAEDHHVVRHSLRLALEREPGFQVVAEAEDGLQAVELAARLKPDVVVMDLRMPRLNGADATRRIVEANPLVKVLALSMVNTKLYVLQALEAGASGFLPKNCRPEELFTAIRSVAAGKSHLSNDVTGMVLDAVRRRTGEVHASQLTSRELEVLQLVAEGLTNREVAARINISEATVDTHRRNIMRKLGLKSVAELTKYAVREGITTLEE